MKKTNVRFNKQHPKLGTIDALTQRIKKRLEKKGNQPAAPVQASASTTDKQEPAPRSVGKETRDLIDLFEANYDFRFNTILGCTELRRKHEEGAEWMAVNERLLNTITMEARLQGINVWKQETQRYLLSNRIADYNPVADYLEQVSGQWDGNDHIATLTATLKTTNAQWPQWMRRWLLALVAQWRGMNPGYGNAVAPLLVSPQGYHKSTFCRRLLPPELQWGYADCLMVSEKHQMLQAMSQLLLINLDEFNQISRQAQQGFVKNIMQLSVVKARRPYGKRLEDLPRLASFIATSNMSDLLSDPSGSRRFFVVEISSPIDVGTPIDHRQLYAQIMHLLDQGERYWFDDDESRAIISHNRQYEQLSPAELCFRDHYRPAINEQSGQWLSASAIFSDLRNHCGAVIPPNGLITFGRALSQMPQLKRRRSHRGTEYLVCACDKLQCP